MRDHITGEYIPPDYQIGGRYYGLEQQKSKNTKRVKRVLAGGFVAAVIGLVCWVSQQPEKIGSAREDRFTHDAFSGKPIPSYRQVIIFNASRQEGIRLHGTPATDAALLSDQPRNNVVGRLRGSIAVERPVLINGHVRIDTALGAVGSAAELARRSSWIGTKVLDQERNDGSPYGIMLCQAGTDIWKKYPAVYDQASGNLTLIKDGSNVSQQLVGDFSELVEDYEEKGWSKEACQP